MFYSFPACCFALFANISLQLFPHLSSGFLYFTHTQTHTLPFLQPLVLCLLLSCCPSIQPFLPRSLPTPPPCFSYPSAASLVPGLWQSSSPSRQLPSPPCLGQQRSGSSVLEMQPFALHFCVACLLRSCSSMTAVFVHPQEFIA